MRITHDYMPDQGPQSYKDVTGRIIACKGGGGGGQAYYGNMDKLYGEQARAAQFMLDQSMPYLPGTMQNTAAMTSEAMSGQLGERARRQAGIDADAAAGDAINTMNQNLAGYGINPNSGLFAGQNRKLAVANAANKVGAMNQAGQWGEEQKWNRNAGQFGQLTGMSSGAMQGMSSAAGGFGQMAGQMSANDRANAAGYGQFGAAMASGLMKADGGYITTPKGLRLAAGGDVWSAYKRQNPIRTGGPQGGGTNPLSSVAAGAAPAIVGQGLKAAWNSKLAEPLRKGLSDVGSKIYDGISDAGTKAIHAIKNPGGSVDTEFGSAFDKATSHATDKAASDLSEQMADKATEKVGEELGERAAEKVGEQVADKALSFVPGIGQGISIAKNLAEGDHIGAALSAVPVVGSYLDGFKDIFFSEGGQVSHEVDVRNDFTPGGKVNGPGTETSDSIPAWLSKGEYVLNAEAVKLVGKDGLDYINNLGLQKRCGAGGLPKKGDAVALAGGGFLGGNLGIALGSGVQEWNRQREMDDQKQYRDKVVSFQENADRRAQASHDAQMGEMQRLAKEREAVSKVFAAEMPVFQGGWKKAAEHLASQYKSNDPTLGYNDGNDIDFQVGDNGVTVVQKKPDGTLGTPMTFTPQQVMAEHMRGVHAKLASISPQHADRFMSWLDAQRREDEVRSEKAGEKQHKLDREKIEDERWELEFGEKRLNNQAHRNFYNSRAGAYESGAIGAGGRASRKVGGAASDDDGGAPSVSIMPINKFSQILPEDVKPKALDAHSWYVSIKQHMPPELANNPKAETEAIRHAVNIANGTAKPIATFNPKTLGWDYGVSDENGNPYSLGRNVDPRKFWQGKIDDSAYRKQANEVIASLMKSDPTIVDQAKAVTQKRLENGLTVLEDMDRRYKTVGLTPEELRLRNAGILYQMYVEPAKGSGKVGATGKPERWYDTNSPTDMTNSEGTPNAIGNAFNGVRNWFAEQARKNVYSDNSWGTERNWNGQ